MSSEEPREFYQHLCGNKREISQYEGDVTNLIYGYYRIIHGKNADLCLKQCCESNWCDYVLVSNGVCFGIQCLLGEKCKPAKLNHDDDDDDGDGFDDRVSLQTTPKG